MNFNPVFAVMLIVALLVLNVGQWMSRRQADAEYDHLRNEMLDSIERNAGLTELNHRLQASLADSIRDRNAANLRAARAAQQIRCLPSMTLEKELPVGTHIGPFSLN